MSLAQFGLQFICDACSATGVGPGVHPGDEPVDWFKSPVPDGWTQIGPGLRLQVTNVYGAAVNHLCPACSALPIGELAALLIAVADKTMES